MTGPVCTAVALYMLQYTLLPMLFCMICIYQYCWFHLTVQIPSQVFLHTDLLYLKKVPVFLVIQKTKSSINTVNFLLCSKYNSVRHTNRHNNKDNNTNAPTTKFCQYVPSVTKPSSYTIHLDINNTNAVIPVQVAAVSAKQFLSVYCTSPVAITTVFCPVIFFCFLPFCN